MDYIQKLQKHGGKATCLVRHSLVTAVSESVTKWKPFFFNKTLESLNGAIVWIQEQLGHRHHLKKGGNTDQDYRQPTIGQEFLNSEWKNVQILKQKWYGDMVKRCTCIRT